MRKIQRLRNRRDPRSTVPLAMTGLLGGAFVGIMALQMMNSPTVAEDANGTTALARGDPANALGCSNPKVVDGDTLRCGAIRIRLHGIDAPEMEGRCRAGRECVEGDPKASTVSLQSMVAGQQMDCRQTDTDRYGRAVALCSVQGQDLSCAQVQSGHAIMRYAPLSC